MSKTILVIDDDKLFRKSITKALKDGGFTVKEAEDGNKGLAMAVELKPDLVVTDITMPGLNGLDLVGKLRQDPAGKDLRIIVLSADETTDSLNQALQQGVTVYIAKDHLSPETVVEQITAAIG